MINYEKMYDLHLKTKNDISFMKGHIQNFLNKIARKRVREEVRQNALCQYINPNTKRLCSSYKTKNSDFCHAHERENPYGENHIFKKKENEEGDMHKTQNEDDENSMDDLFNW